MAKYRVGVIGCGRKGGSHARAYALNPLTEVVAFADTDPENLELYCKYYDVPGYSDYREMLDKERVDIAAPILPVRPNPEVVIGCAEAGVKAILCEKPIAASLADADRMVAACQSRGIKLGAGDLDRNLPQYWKALEIIESGELGEVKSINFIGGSGTEMSGGGCQLFSLMRLFAGDADVAWVIGWVADDPESDHDQGVAGYLRFTNVLKPSCTVNLMRGDVDLRFRAVAVYSVDNSLLSLWKADGDIDPLAGGSLKKVEGVFPETSVYGRMSGDYDADGWRWPGDRNVASVQSIIDALEQDIEPRGSGDNGRKVLEIAIALRESHRRGHVPVRLPLEDRSLRLFPEKFTDG